MIVQTHGPALNDLIDDLPFDLEDQSQAEAAGDFCAQHAQLIMANFGQIFRDTTIPPTAKMIAKLADFVDELQLRYQLRNVARDNQREMWLDCLADLARTYEHAIVDKYYEDHKLLKGHLDSGFVSLRDRNDFLHAVVLGKYRKQQQERGGRDHKVRKLSVIIDGTIAHLDREKPQYQWRKDLERLIDEQYMF